MASLLKELSRKKIGGWYTIELVLSNDDDQDIPRILKRRARELRHIVTSDHPNMKDVQTNAPVPKLQANEEDAATGRDNECDQNPPNIIDLDAAMDSYRKGEQKSKTDEAFLEQCVHHASFKSWVLFTDLHCMASSLNVSLQVLDTVHREARDRGAGVIFLGDFWHHRGTVRVDCLNAVLSALSTWEVPLIMIPGNHDQVTLGGIEHGLTPLANAYRIEDVKTKRSVAGPLILSEPTKFGNALFVPHIRDATIMESVLRSDLALRSECLFVHADVKGAYMNDLIVSHGGIPPYCFPPHKPIYSGHFHKPHIIDAPQSAPGVSIRYVGSPYETSLSEASQKKALIILDRSAEWACVEEAPLNVGRKHFRAHSMEDLLNLSPHLGNDIDLTSYEDGQMVRAGDRVVVSVPKEELEELRREAKAHNGTCEFDIRLTALRNGGASVELRELKSIPTGPRIVDKNDDMVNPLEDLKPNALMASFFSHEVDRGSMKTTTTNVLLEAAIPLMEELEVTSDVLTSTSFSIPIEAAVLLMESVTVQGYGPFKEPTTYPLHDRGLVLLKGRNTDGGSDSNGSGKSTLAMSALWALTGSADARPFQDSKVLDVVNDFSNSAKVSLCGRINSTPFTITRIKTSSKGSLEFILDEEDLTRQSIKETQALIDEKLGVGSEILRRTMFHGQHSLHGLLEATDKTFKDELSIIVSLSLWQDAASLARLKSRNAAKEVSTFEGMTSLREKDLEQIVRHKTFASEELMSKQAALDGKRKSVEEELEKVSAATLNMNQTENTLEACQTRIDETTELVQHLEDQLHNLIQDRDAAIALIHSENVDLKVEAMSAREQLQQTQRSFDRVDMLLTTSIENVQNVKSKWDLESISGNDTVYVPPAICPTCKQPIEQHGDGHSHDDIRLTIENEITAASLSVKEAQVEWNVVRDKLEKCNDHLTLIESRESEALSKLRKVEVEWNDRIVELKEHLIESRSMQRQRSQEFSDAALHMQQMSKYNTLQAHAKGEIERLDDAVGTAERAYQDACANFAEKEKNLLELEMKRGAAESQAQVMLQLANVFGPKGIQTFLLQNAIEALKDASQAYLNVLSDGSQKLDLSLDDSDRIVRTGFLRSPDGNYIERPLSSLSGGQWRRCSLALSFGFSDLVARRGRLRPSLLVLDEPLTHLDAFGRAQVGKLLRILVGQNEEERNEVGLHGLNLNTILVILQDLAAEELDESFDKIDEVTKKGGFSRVLIDEDTP